MMLICKPLKLAIPPTAALVKVPNNAPLPDPLALATVIVPVASVPVVTRLLNASRTWITGCEAKLTPAISD